MNERPLCLRRLADAYASKDQDQAYDGVSNEAEDQICSNCVLEEYNLSCRLISQNASGAGGSRDYMKPHALSTVNIAHRFWSRDILPLPQISHPIRN